MPLYDYRCHKCGETFEVKQSFSEDPLTIHEGCGGEVERLISVPALQFKGTGWYVTDYGRGGKTPATNGKPDTKSDSDSKSKSEPAKTETKTESKTETKSEPAKSSSTDK